jgi:hypothetical protein
MSSYSKTLDKDILECIEDDITKYSKNGDIMLCGDFNARVADGNDLFQVIVIGL